MRITTTRENIGQIEVGFGKHVKTYATIEGAIKAAEKVADKFSNGMWSECCFNVRVIPVTHDENGVILATQRYTPSFFAFRGGPNHQQVAIFVAQMGYLAYA